MATELKLRRGTTSQHDTFTGAEAEITVDTDKNTVVVHDGTTEGGFPLAREFDLESIIGGDLSWDSSADTYSREYNFSSGVTRVHENMRRCLLLDDGTVNY